jgi:hypothetical protein
MARRMLIRAKRRTLPRSHPYRAALAGLGVLVWCVGPARSLECPVAQPTTTANALQETRQTIDEFSGLLAAQGTGVVPEIVSQLRRKYPWAHDAEIANYLVTLYCPVIARDASLSDSEKADRLGAFSSQVMQMLATR